MLTKVAFPTPPKTQTRLLSHLLSIIDNMQGICSFAIVSKTTAVFHVYHMWAPDDLCAVLCCAPDNYCISDIHTQGHRLQQPCISFLKSYLFIRENEVLFLIHTTGWWTNFQAWSFPFSTSRNKFSLIQVKETDPRNQNWDVLLRFPIIHLPHNCKKIKIKTANNTFQ